MVDADLHRRSARPSARSTSRRTALGLPDDLTWSLTVMDTTTRATTTWSVGTLLVFALAWIWLTLAPQSLAMQASRWAFPAASIFHLLGMVLFIGMRVVLDLRVTGWAFGGISASEVGRRVGPWSLVGAIVTVVSGMALYSADPERMAANPLFQVKVAALAAALVNAWFFHAVLTRRARDWDTSNSMPAAVRASAYLSLTLWVAIIVVARLIAFI